MSLPKPFYEDAAVTIYNARCEDILPHLGMFDLLLTDPPYGIGADNRKQILSRANKAAARDYGESSWDNSTPSDEIMDLIRSKAAKQIIWGGNYFNLPPCVGPLIWDKENTGDFADGEMAWNNLRTALRIRRHMWNGMLRKGGEEREHPTQKPLEIMSWCIGLAGDGVQTILDPFAGSCTTARAAKDLGRKCVCIEREERYCEIGARRMAQEVFTF